MTGDEVCYLSIWQLTDYLHRRSLSSAEVVEAYLDRIQRLDGLLQTYLVVTADQARSAARHADAELARGLGRGPLHGVPLALKDLFDTAGVPSTAGSRLLAERVPNRDAHVVARLREAGALLLGKLTMHEFALGTPRLDDAIKPARNPWNPGHVPGGSSSGSAAALAAGLCAGSLGSDTAGSIRGPAAYCGVVGLKPTYGLVSRRGMIPLAWSLDHAGPLARTVVDAALLLEAIAGHDPQDPASVPTALRPVSSALTGELADVRVGVPWSLLEAAPVDADVRAALDAALDVLRDAGARVRAVSIPEAVHTELELLTIMLSEAAAYHQVWLRTRADDYSAGMRRRLFPGLGYSAVQYVQAQRGRARLREQLAGVMREVELVALPTHPRTAPSFTDEYAIPPSERGMFTRLFNLTGQPSLSVPCGFDRAGLPIGLMLSGRAFDDLTVLRAGDAYQRRTDWHLRHPPLAG